MFKDYEKYLSTSLKVYLFVLFVVFILKLVGLDYFGLDTNNKIFTSLDIFFKGIYVRRFIYFVGIMVYQYFMLSIFCKDNSKRLKIYTLCTIPSTFAVQYVKLICNNHPTTYLLEFVYLIAISKIYDKNTKISVVIKRLFIIFILQFISNFTRNQSNIRYETNFVNNVILNIDYFIMLVIYQKVELEGGLSCQDLVGLFSQKKLNLKNLLKKLQKNLHNFKQLDKKTKLTYIIYFLFSFIWNVLTIIIVLLFAKLNHTFIECIFILSSFWLSKRIFGKAFHLPSMVQCFVVSNLTYYVLNRITTPLGISILVPIMLGVGLSYVTSKLVKKLYKPLYRGMPEELFNETILKVEDKGSYKYKICYDYFVLKKSAVSVAMKYTYSEAGIKKIKDRVNKKIKELFI